jgi:hypothetical protein
MRNNRRHFEADYIGLAPGFRPSRFWARLEGASHLTSVSTSVMLKRVFINRCNAILGNALGFSVDDEGHRCPTRNNYLIWAATAPNRELMYYTK